jgi:uncharacterized membrane protein YphA (DoxX/SURF4 family)
MRFPSPVSLVLGMATIGAFVWNNTYSRQLKLAAKGNVDTILGIETAERNRTISIFFVALVAIGILAICVRAKNAERKGPAIR